MVLGKRSYAREGFSLMEIMIALLILGLVAAMVGPAAFNALKNARKSTAKSTMRAFKNAIGMFQTHTGQYPQMLKDLIKKPRDEKVAKKWEGPYIDKTEIPEDPWNQPFVYKVTAGGKHPYELYSRGPNGTEAPKEEWIDVWAED
jgi:general secretion pathway protein G